MITVKELAKLCGVSPSTISNILNGKPNVGEETRQRVLQVVQETGYQPNYFASGMRKQNSKLISIIVEDLNQFTTPPIVGAIMTGCEEKGYKTILMDMRLYDRWKDTWFDDDEKLKTVLTPMIRETESIKADGCIYVAGHGRGIHYFPKQYSIPTVICYANSDKDRFPSVLIDDEKGGYDMGRFLLEKGHRRIAVLTGVENNMHSQKRLEGYQRALFEAGVPYNPSWTLHGNWKRECGYQMAERLLALQPTVIWCMNDQMAGGVYQYLYEHGIVVGKDISVAGYDNMEEASYMYPRLATNALPLKEIGRRSAEILIRMIEEEGWRPECIKTWVPCEMVQGNSVMEIGEA